MNNEPKSNPVAEFWDKYDKEIDKLKTKFEKSQLLIVNTIAIEKVIKRIIK